MKSSLSLEDNYIGCSVKKAIEDFENNNKIPTILFCGKSGSGKSSILNALAGKYIQEVGVVDTTKSPVVKDIHQDRYSLRAIDLGGFGRAGEHKERLAAIFQQVNYAHILLMVIGFPDRAFEMEVGFLSDFNRYISQQQISLPIIGTLNKIDMAPPRSEWQPEKLRLTQPTTSKEKSITDWGKYVKSTLSSLKDSNLIYCSAGDNWADIQSQYGIDKLRRSIYDVLPEAAQTIYARIMRDMRIIEEQAQNIIWSATLSAAVAALQPIPQVPDAALIAPIQVAMIVALAHLHGADVTQTDAVKLLGPVVASMAGRLLFEQIVKFIPGLGSILGAAVAGSITISLGQAYHYLMKKGIWAPSKEEILCAFAQSWEKNKNLSYGEIERQTKLAKRK